MEEKLKKILLNVFSLLFICFSFYIVFTGVFNSSISFYKMKPLIIIAGSIGLFLLLYFIDKKLKLLKDSKLKKIVICSFIIIIILQLGFVVLLFIKPSWDYSRVLVQARELALGNYGFPEYFYDLYPNNIGLTLLMGAIFKLVNIFTDRDIIYLGVAIMFNILMINASIYVLYKLIYKLFGLSRATMFTIFVIMITPFYSYSQIVYTDTTTMVFPIAMLLMLYNYINSEKRNKYIYLICIGIIGVIGTILKTNIVICLIAIFIYLILTNKLIIGVKNCVIISIPFVIIISIYQSLVPKFIPIEYKEAGLPYTHWVMMGLKGPYGFYDSDDVKFSKGIKLEQGKEATREANISVIKERLNNYGVKGCLELVNKKVETTWGDGTYFAPNKLSRFPIGENNVRKYVIGDKKAAFVYISQFSHVIILITILIGAIKAYKKPTDFVKVIHISIFGVFLFLILWETRSRYLICYLPVMILACSYGIDYAFKLIDSK